MIGRPTDAYFYLRSGEFEKAKTIFSQLLDNDPGSQEWKEGYYASSFWDNKLDHLLSLREGKERGKALLHYLHLFEKEVSARNFPLLTSYQESVQCVLEETSHHLGIAFRLEGWNGLDEESILGLATCHLRLKNFSHALEILNLAKGDKFQSTELHFLRADALVGLDRYSEGIPLFIHGFLDDPAKLPIRSLQWTKIQEAFQKAEKLQPLESFPFLLCPYLIVVDGEWDSFMVMEEETFLYWNGIFQRIYDSSRNHKADYRKKSNLRLGFIAEVLVRSRMERNFPVECGEIKSIKTEIQRELKEFLSLD